MVEERAQRASRDHPAQPQVVFLPSPLLGPAVWDPVARTMQQSGWSVTVAATPAEPETPDDVLDAFLGSLPQGRDLVLVPHSNAGLYVPRLILERDVVACVFVDAALPPEQGSAPLAPAALVEFLAARADRAGVLPPWTRWWPDSDVEALFPSEAVRRLVEAEQPRMPLSYFQSSVPVPEGWLDIPSAYLAFGDTYADERQQATDWGWPTETMPGRHLHMLVDPDDVAATVIQLLGNTSDAGAGRAKRNP